MEVAAKKVQLLSENILPEQPHQLAFAIDKRYRVNPDNIRGLEENIYRGLQYMTYVSDGDRGLLLAKSYHDMRDEPPTTNANPSATPARSDKKPSTKISLSDYKNKVKKQSQSPPQPAMSFRADESRASSHETRNHQDHRRKDGPHAPREVKSQGVRDSLLNDRPSSLPPKPPVPVRDPHGSPDRRKRAAEEDDTTRPPKRTKPEVNGSSQERVRTPKHDAIRNGGSEIVRKRDASNTGVKSPRSSENRPSSSLEVNGRTILKAAMNSNRPGSPEARSRSRATSLNGVRPNSSGSSKTTPNKTATSSSAKAAVPPLLSPLHPSFNESEPVPRSERNRREDISESQRGGRIERTAGSKKQMLPLELPPLLSPTLPPLLEAELARRNKTPSKSSDSKSSADIDVSPSSPFRKKKKARQSREDDEEEVPRKRFIVTMKYNKRTAKHVQRLLALPARKERSSSTDSQPSQPSKKRPLPSSGGTITVDPSEPMATKRPRKSEITSSAKTMAPSTPQRSSISVAHHVNTPGEGGPEASSQQKVLLANIPPNVAALKQRYERYKDLGTKLKHARDDVVKNFPPTNGVRQMPEAVLKLSTVTGIEAILSYMAAFNALSEARYLERKVKDPSLWKSLLPLVNELQLSVREHVFPKAVLSILQEIALQELLACLLVSGDFGSRTLLQDLHRFGREHDKVKRLLPSLFRQVEEANEEAAFPLELPLIYSGEPVEQAVSKTLIAIRSWTVREKVEWEAKLSTEEVLSGA